MLASKAPEVFLDPKHPNSKITLDRLVEVIVPSEHGNIVCYAVCVVIDSGA